MLAPLVIAVVVGYLLGSLPFGYLIARAKGVNIFEVGSKSSGATNVRRVIGSSAGILVLFLDLIKGALAAFIAAVLCPSDAYWALFVLIGIVGALLGHSFSCFTRFRGGKGVATAAGGFLVLFPLGTLTAALVWGVAVALTRYVSLASMVAGVALVAAALLLHQPPLVLGACALVMAFVIVRHRANISRLLAGTENKIGQKPAEPKP